MAQGEGALGRVGWSICETVSCKVIGQGVLAVEPENVEVDEHRTAEDVIYYRKRIRLTPPFQFAIDEHPGKKEKDVKGFGLTAINDDVQTYSWEWFNVTEPHLATKLQEEGSLSIEIAEATRGWEVMRTEFLTDVSLRMTRLFGDPSEEPFWRATICKGSWIAWPPAD